MTAPHPPEDASEDQMFDLFVLKQWPAREVARTLGVTIGDAYAAKHRIAKLIRQEVQVLEAKGV